MRVPLSWIHEFVDLHETPDDIGRAFDQLGIEVEGIELFGEGVEGVIAARVLDVSAHPNADRLRLVSLDYGDGQTTVVCGAPNLDVGMVAPFAPSGATVAGGMKMQERKIRGEMSNGMLCSEQDLGIGNAHGGIIHLPTDTQIGSEINELLGIGDAVFHLSITANRPDAMCVIGLARELAAHFGRTLRVPLPAVKGGSGTYRPEPANVEVSDPERCGRYLGWRATVPAGPSPPWLARRLVLAGMRPINLVVDVTNYVLLERNQPLHAFDFQRIGGGVIVRRATEGEKITTLDGKEHALTTEDLVICNAHNVAQAIAGIMGGEDSQVTVDTQEILLEAAYFSPRGVSVSSRRLGLRTEASSRFDRGIDPNAVLEAATRAMELLEQNGAEVAPDFVDAHPLPVAPMHVQVRTARVNHVLGTALRADEVRHALDPLGLKTEGSGEDFTVIVPTYRPDVTREIDVIEEVGRRIGYQNIPVTMPVRSFHRGYLTKAQQERRLLAEVLVGNGFSEAKCFPLLSPEDVEFFGLPRSAQTVVTNPLRKEESVLANTLLPGLLKSVAYNSRQANHDLALFEIDTVFHDDGDRATSYTELGDRATGHTLMDERVNLAAVLTGSLDERPTGAVRKFHAHDLTRVLADIAEALGLSRMTLEAGPVEGFDRNCAARVLVDGMECGVVGELASTGRTPGARESSDRTSRARVFAFELRTDVLFAGKRRPRESAILSVHPPSYFDLAFEVAAGVAAAQLVEAVRSGGGAVIEQARPFDVFTGEQVGVGRKSVAIAIVARALDHTLTEAELRGIRQACIDAAAEQCGAIIRGVQ